MIEAHGARWRLVAHAIVSAEGCIADADGAMPPCLHVPEDQRRFRAALEGAALTVLGREGHERHPAGTRRRLVLTSRVAALEAEGRATLWNPDGAPLAEALRLSAPGGGEVVVAGGTRVMTALLPVTDRFDLVIARDCRIPDGRPCLVGTRSVAEIAARLERAGLARAETRPLAPGATLHVHLRDETREGNPREGDPGGR